MIKQHAKSTKNIVDENKEIINTYYEKIKNIIHCPSLNLKEDTVLITGGAGFLALHMINALIEKGITKKIICVIRNPIKYKENKKKYGFSFEEDKLLFIVKDVMDLSKDDIVGVDRVIHSAAQIDALKSFRQLKRNNIEVSIHLYQLCYTNNIPITLISTLSIWVSSNITGLHKEQFVVPNENHIIYGGYAQTKWLAEYLSPPNTQIIRLGLLTGDSVYGIFPEKDFFSILIGILKEIKVCPQYNNNAWVDITPVDIAAKNIIKCMGQNKIMHIANNKSTSLQEIINELQLEIVNQDIFKEKIKSYPSLYKKLLENAFFKEKIESYYFNVDLFQATNHYWIGDNTINIENNKILKKYIYSIKSI